MKTKPFQIIPAISALAAILLFTGTVSAALVTGKSIGFLDTDFNAAGFAQKGWAIYSSDSSSDTEIWAQTRVVVDIGATTKDRMVMNGASNDAAAWVTWKITVPEDRSITGFTWAVSKLILAGAQAGDDSFVFEYSLNEADWTTFYTEANHGRASALTINNLSQSVTLDLSSLSGQAVQAVYIRARHVEGTSASNDGGYWALTSNVTANYAGGFDLEHTYVSVQTQAIPEPAHAVTLLVVAGLIAAVWHRRSKNRR